jgi:hypothetical protein
MGVVSLPLSASPESIREAWGPGDAGSLLEVALTWSNFQQLDPTTQFWIVHLWSPGMSVIEVPLIWLNNLFGIPIYWSILLITSAVIFLNYVIYRKLASSQVEKLLLLVIVFMLLLSWDFKYILRDGIFYTEGIGYFLLTAGLGSMCLNIISSTTISKKQALWCGLLVGVSIWVRHVSDNGLIILAVLSALMFFFQSKLGLKSPKSNDSKRQTKRQAIQKQRIIQKIQTKKSVKFVLAASLIAIAVTIPWRIASQTVFKGDPFVMSSASSEVGPGLWIDQEENPDFYWLPNNMNWACNIDSEKCQTIGANIDNFTNSEKTIEAVKSAASNPGAYLIERGSYLSKFWIPDFVAKASFGSKLAATFPILLSFGSVILFIKIRNKIKWQVLLIWAPFLVTHIIQLLVIHFESRYFIPIRLMSLGLFMCLLRILIIENPKYENFLKVLKQTFLPSATEKLKANPV